MKNLLEIVNFNDDIEEGEYRLRFKDGQVFNGKLDTYNKVVIEVNIDNIIYGVVLTLFYDPDRDTHYIGVLSDRVVSDKVYYKLRDIDIIDNKVIYEF